MISPVQNSMAGERKTLRRLTVNAVRCSTAYFAQYRLALEGSEDDHVELNYMNKTIVSAPNQHLLLLACNLS